MLNLKTVHVIFKNGSVGQACAEGNNAAWECPCGRTLPLLGTTRHRVGDTQCPNCNRIFHAVPHAGKKGQQVVEVREV